MFPHRELFLYYPEHPGIIAPAASIKTQEAELSTMQYRTLGRTDLKVSVVAMGCWPIVGDATWGAQDEKDSIAALESALGEGINFFDAAETYGNGYSEELLGRVFADRRREVVIASKVSRANLRPANLKAACEGSLRRLGTDYIDLYQVHWPNWDVPIADTLGALEELKAEGKIRVVGGSNFGPRDLADLLAHGRVEVNQLPYSLLWRTLEHQVQPLCVQNQVSIITYCPLAQGLLAGKFASADDVPEGRARTRLFSGDRPQARHQEPGAEKETFQAIDGIREISKEVRAPMAQVALAWLLSRPAVASVLAGARNPDQIRMNAGAADLKLSEDVVERLARISDPLKQRFGTNIDMWQSESRLR